MITSTQNPRVQQIRLLQSKAKARRNAGLFVVEGVRLVEEALQAGWQAQTVLYSEQLSARGRLLLNGLAARGAFVEQADERVLAAASDTETPQGILAVLELRKLALPEQVDFVFISDGLRDPGNLGSALRSAGAAGVQVVLIPPGSVDPFSPKVIRSAMGAHFRLPVLAMNWGEIRGFLQQHALRPYLAAAREGIAYTQANFSAPSAILLGGEADGAGDEARSLDVQPIHIPMPGGLESLNAATAASILFFEVVRQRSL